MARFLSAAMILGPDPVDLGVVFAVQGVRPGRRGRSDRLPGW